MFQLYDWLYIGKYRDTIDPQLLEMHAISAMLTFAEPVHYEMIPVFFLPVLDGLWVEPRYFEQGLGFIEKNHKQGAVLVACGAGISRSTTFCIAALHQFAGMTLPGAYKFVRKQYPIGFPHPELWESMCFYFGVHIPYETLIFNDI